MSKPNLRVLPNPTAETMALLGGLPIAGVIGTYDHNVKERDELLAETLTLDDGDYPATLRSLEVRRALMHVQWRLWIYAELAQMVAEVVG